jgi:hypothetical protein
MVGENAGCPRFVAAQPTVQRLSHPRSNFGTIVLSQVECGFPKRNQLSATPCATTLTGGTLFFLWEAAAVFRPVNKM